MDCCILVFFVKYISCKYGVSKTQKKGFSEGKLLQNKLRESSKCHVKVMVQITICCDISYRAN